MLAHDLDDHACTAEYLRQSQAAMAALAGSAEHAGIVCRMAALVAGALRAGGMLLICGNGGSAGDAQHLAGEFTGRMLYDRPPLPALALHADTSALTAIANDYGFEAVYERQVRALGRRGDVVLGLSTSGRSPNVLRALQAAREGGMHTLGFTGAGGGDMGPVTDLLLQAPSSFTPVVQQLHITAGHALCILVERALHPRAG